MSHIYSYVCLKFVVSSYQCNSGQESCSCFDNVRNFLILLVVSGRGQIVADLVQGHFPDEVSSSSPWSGYHFCPTATQN